MNETLDPTQTPFVIVREFDAPRELVWQAWTNSEHLKRWWGPSIFTTPVYNIDLRVGGKIHFCMRSPDGMEFWCGGEYTEIDPPSHLASTSYFSNEAGEQISPSTFGFDPNWPEVTTIDLRFEDLGGRTRLTMSQIGVTLAMARGVMADQGWGEQFDKLAAYLPNLAQENGQ